MTTIDEAPKHRELRIALRQITNCVSDLQQHDISQGDIPAVNVSISPMVLDANSKSRPIFFAPYTSTSLPYPDGACETEYDNFDSIEPEDRKPIDCARIVDHYFSYYISFCFSGRKYNKDDIQWSPIRYLPFFPPYH